jgi:sugar lactone lactonase YvrE
MFGAVAVALVFVVSVATADNLFVSDTWSASGWVGGIYKYTPDANSSMFATGLSGPAALAFNSSGDLFEADSYSGSIYEFTPSGARSTFADFSASHGHPRALAFDAAGDLFATVGLYGGTSTAVDEFAPDGYMSTFAVQSFSSGIAASAALAFNSSGDLFESDVGQEAIFEFTPGGAESVFASGFAAFGLAFDRNGNLFAGNFGGSGNIYEFTPNGGAHTYAPTSNLIFGSLAIDSEGDLFAVGIGVGNTTGIYQETPTGTFSTFATGLADQDGGDCLAFAPAPEPPTVSLLGIATVSLLAFGWRRRRVP